MNVNKINGISNQILKKSSEKMTKPKGLVKTTEIAIGSTIAAASGIYTVKKAQEKQEYKKILQGLNITDKMLDKIINIKNDNGEKVFNKDNLKILSEVGNLEDKTFYNCIIKNLDGIQSFKEDTYYNFIKETDDSIYVMNAKTKNGEIEASITPKSFYEVKIKQTDKNKETITRSIFINDVLDNYIEYKKDGNLVSVENFLYDKSKNIIKRTIYDNNRNIKQANLSAFSQDGILTDKTVVRYDTNEQKDIISNSVNHNYEKHSVNITSGRENLSEISSKTHTYINPRTGRKETHFLSPSDISGVYNSYFKDDFGNIKIESIGKVDKFGNQIVKKELESFDGTKTNYYYKSSKDNNDIQLSYNITDKDGNKLMTMDRTFKRVNPNLAYSSINGHRYEILKNENIITVKDFFNDEVTEINLKDICYHNYNPKTCKIFDKMSGDMLLNFYKKGYKYINVENSKDFEMSYVFNTLRANDNIYAFAHEHGHVKDIEKDINTGIKNVIASNPEVQKVYNQERLEFIKHKSLTEKQVVDYFINTSNHNAGKLGSAKETVAEINALLSTEVGLDNGETAARGYYLQKYFPKTIATVAKFLNPDGNLLVNF